MLVGFISFIIFLFTVYQLSKDDFLFIRKGMTVDQVFDIVFLGLPLSLLSARIFYVLFHPSWHYLNPLIFFVVPYFPGLSLIGGIIGAWVFLTLYTKNKKVASQRLFDMLSLAFLLAMSIGIMLTAALGIQHNRIMSVEEIARGVLGIMLYITLLLQFIKGIWIEGTMAYLAVSLICLLTFMNIGTLYVLHQPIVLGTAITTGIVGVVALILFLQRKRFFHKLVGKR